MTRRGFLATVLSIPIIINQIGTKGHKNYLPSVKPQVRPKKLKCTWTMETIEDLRRMHGITSD